MNSPSRRYRSPRREQDAARTRQDILKAAFTLFAERGYARVTMTDIAQETGIAVKTVYASVGTKSGILSELLAAGLSEGTAAKTNRQIRQTSDLAGCVALVARGTRADKERFMPTINLLHSAKDVDDGAKQVWQSMLTAYRAGLHGAAEDLVVRGLAAPHLDVEAVTDRLWFCFGLGAWRALVEDCRWSYEDAERLLTRQAIAALTDVA
ncbi:TetR/AcrR family transcriptional regulator [Kribbella yunnanensis]|uniref:TetR/AcrR family transcriptional regulator n=1 Tax=Kribbella yunnanensis TaxID=190194 RepID=A0ABP4UWS5_9ACTN